LRPDAWRIVDLCHALDQGYYLGVAEGETGMNDERELPARAGQVAEEQPELWAAFQALGAASGSAGPLDARAQRLAGLALAIGADSEGAVHSHARRGSS
jgi:alkylhydroperoxidase/carboxymuconolactone decarboxylase family protein YurZ